MDYKNMFSLAGKTALVAGASRGIGLAIAEALAANGAATVLASRNLDRLEECASALRNQGLDARALRLDVTDSESIRAAVEAVPAMDILINVAGTNIRKPFEKYTKQEYQFLLQTNLDGIVELTQLAGARMIERGHGGKIISIGSLLSLVGLPYASIYAITKGAIAQLTKVLAAEWGRHNIQVNCIAPGFIETDLNRKMWQDPAMIDWLKGSQAIPFMGTPADVAPLAVFLSGQCSNYITGQVIAVDGGQNNTGFWPFQP